MLSYATYLGSSNYDEASGIAVDGEGQAYVAAYTRSTNFPVTRGAFQIVSSGGPHYNGDAFVAKLSADGSTLVYATYLGGNNMDYAYDIAVDGSGQAYVAGVTWSDNFLVTAGAFQPVYGGGYNDAFVARLSADGASLVNSTYLGGSAGDWADGIAVDEEGQVYVAGGTNSSNFPTTAGAFQPVYGGNVDAFVAKFSADGAALVYGTYLGGGDDNDSAEGIAVDGIRAGLRSGSYLVR